MNVLVLLKQLKFSRQLFAVITFLPVLLVLFGLYYFNFILKTPWLSVVLIFFLIIIPWIAARFVRKLSVRIVTIKEGVRDLAEGKLREVPAGGDDEITDIMKSINSLSAGLKRTSAFTQQIGAGNLDASYTAVSESDMLGHSLLKMKNDLVAIKAEDAKRIWTTESLARFADVLQSNRNLKQLAEEIIKNLVKTLKANQGAVFILNDEKEEDTYLEMKACYAYDRIKMHTQRVEIGSGILGQAFLEKDTVYLKQIPKNFVRITSGLGEATPTCLLVVPLKVNDDIVGLVEIASFAEFEKHQIAFVEKLGENVAYAIRSFRINENTAKLLTESQAQTEQMKAQEEELRQNQEEMQATQEEISRKYDVLFKQLTELNYASKFDQLKSITFSKKRNIEYYFDIIRSQIITFSENRTVIEAITDFSKAFYKVSEPSEYKLAEMKTSLRQYYENDFLKKLNDNAAEVKSLNSYLPEEERTVVFQYNYLSANPFPTGQKHQLNAANDGSEYSKLHAEYHPLLRNFLEKFGYYDIFLIALNGDMLYSVFKEVDYATNLLTGIYSKTNFGRVVKQAIDSKDRSFVKLIDFEPYDPSYRAPASFIACPVYDHDKKIGILVFQMPINKINQVLTGNNGWEDDGLGQTGETFIVGNDFKLRSISRGLIQQPETYLSHLNEMGYDIAVINEIRKANTSILLEENKTESSRKAIRGITGTQLDKNGRGTFLSAYTPLQIEDVNWVVMSTLSEEEASKKINDLRSS